MTLRGVVLLVTLLGGALAGYQVGSWSLGQARAQLAALDKASEQALRESEAMREKLEEELTALKVEHECKTTLLAQTFKGEQLELRSSLAATPSRIAELEARRRQNDEALRGMLKAQESATGELQSELQRKKQELRSLQDKLEREQAGVACLTTPVPGEEIRILNTHSAQEERVQR